MYISTDDAQMYTRRLNEARKERNGEPSRDL